MAASCLLFCRHSLCAGSHLAAGCLLQAGAGAADGAQGNEGPAGQVCDSCGIPGGGGDVAHSVCGHAMLANVQHHSGAREVSGPALFGTMPDVEVPSVALQKSSQAAVGNLKAELQHHARMLQGTLGAQQASQTEVSRLP